MPVSKASEGESYFHIINSLKICVYCLGCVCVIKRMSCFYIMIMKFSVCCAKGVLRLAIRTFDRTEMKVVHGQ